jgi:deoxyinosine 3'endonuclease (endonuclease V)
MILEDSPEIAKLISCCNHGNTSHDFFIGGVDISFVKEDNENACAALIVLNFPQLEVILFLKLTTSVAQWLACSPRVR